MDIDIDQLKSEVLNMTADQLQAELLKARTASKVQQKKSYNSDKAKLYAAKRRELLKAMKERAIKEGYWETIEQAAEDAAESRIANEAVDNQDI